MKHIFLAITASAILYLGGVIIHVSFNITVWHIVTRIILGLIWFVFMFLWMGEIEDKWPKNKKQ